MAILPGCSVVSWRSTILILPQLKTRDVTSLYSEPSLVVQRSRLSIMAISLSKSMSSSGEKKPVVLDKGQTSIKKTAGLSNNYADHTAHA